MEGFDAASFWVGLAIGMINGVSLVCFTRSWRWAGLPAGRPCNVNPPAPNNIRPPEPPKAPPPVPVKKNHVEVTQHVRNWPFDPRMRR